MISDLSDHDAIALNRPDLDEPHFPSGAASGGTAASAVAEQAQDAMLLALDSLADDLASADAGSPAHDTVRRQLQQAVAAGQPRYAAPRDSFAQDLARLWQQLPAQDGELSHAQARSLLEAAGVPNIRSAHLGSTADAALQALLGQVIKMPLRLGAKAVTMIPAAASTGLRAGVRTAVQPARGTAAVAVRQATQPLGNLGRFGRSLPNDLMSQLRRDQETQLKRLLDDLALLQHPGSTSPARPLSPDSQRELAQQICAALKVHDDIEHSAQAMTQDKHTLKTLSCVTAQTRAHLAMAFATLAVDVIAKSGAHAALAGMDLGLLAQAVSLITYPSMAALTQGMRNWYDTKALAGQLLMQYHQAADANGQPPSAEQLQAWSHWAQDHFQHADQANFHRRDEHVFQPALNHLLQRVSESGYQLGQLRELGEATHLEHYRALKQQHKLENRINHVNLKIDARPLAQDKAGMQLLLAFAQATALSTDSMKLLVRKDADVLLGAQARQEQDPELKELFERFRTLYHDRCGAELSDEDLRQLYRQRLGRAPATRAAQLPASARPADPAAALPALPPLGFDWTQGLRKNLRAVWHKHQLTSTYKQLKQRQQLQHRLDDARGHADSLAHRPPDAAAHDPADQRLALQSRLDKVHHQIDTLQPQMQHDQARYQRYHRDAEHYRNGQAGLIDPEGEVAHAIVHHSRGVRAQLRHSLHPAALGKAMRQRLGLGVALPTALTTIAEASRLGLHTLRASPAATSAPPVAGTPASALATTPDTDPLHTVSPPGADHAAAASSHEPPAAASQEPARAARTRRAAAPTETPTASSAGGEVANDSTAQRIQTVLQDLHEQDSAEQTQTAIRANDDLLGKATSYPDWLRRLQQAVDARQQTLSRLQATHAERAPRRTVVWGELQSARHPTDMANTSSHGTGPYQLSSSYQHRVAAQQARWDALITPSRQYLRALREQQDLLQRQRDPEQSYLNGIKDPTLKATAEAALRPLQDFRNRLGEMEVRDACLEVAKLSADLQPIALQLLVDALSPAGLTALLRQLPQLPDHLQASAAQSVAAALGSGPLQREQLAAMAALPATQQALLKSRLSASHSRELEVYLADSVEPAPYNGALQRFQHVQRKVERAAEAERDDLLAREIRKMGEQANFGFGHNQGEVLNLLVKAIQSRPQASRTRLALALIEARMNPLQRPGVQDLRDLRTSLATLEGADQGELWCELTRSIGHLPDGPSRLTAYDEAVGQLDAATERSAQALRALTDLIAQLPAHAQAERFSGLSDRILQVSRAEGEDIFLEWAALTARLKVSSSTRAQLLITAIKQGAALYGRDHIGRTLQAAPLFLNLMPQLLQSISDGKDQLPVLTALIDAFKLNRSDGPMRWVEFDLNTQVTREFFEQVLACVHSIARPQQAEAVELLGRAIRRGDFDQLGNSNTGAAGIRLDHFTALARQVQQLDERVRAEAMERLLSQAFARTLEPMGYQRQGFERWETINTFESLGNAFTEHRPPGLAVHDEAELFADLGAEIWKAAWLDEQGTIGQLMRRIGNDLKARLTAQQRVDAWGDMIHRAISIVTDVLNGRLGPRMPRPPITSRPGTGGATVPNNSASRIEVVRGNTQGGGTQGKTSKGGSPNDPPLASRGAASSSTPAAPPPGSSPQYDSLQAFTTSHNSKIPTLPKMHLDAASAWSKSGTPVPRKIYRVMRGNAADLRRNGIIPTTTMRKYPPGTDPTDIRLAEIVCHTAGSSGSAGVVQSFSERPGVTYQHARAGEVNLRLTVQTHKADGTPHPGFRTASDILCTEGPRLVKAGLITEKTLADAIRNVSKYSESEVFNVNGHIAPELIENIHVLDQGIWKHAP